MGRERSHGTFTTRVAGIRLGMIHFGPGTRGSPGSLGVGLRTFLRNLGLQSRSFGEGRNFAEA